MEIKSKGYDIHFTIEEATALLKIVGKSSLYTLIKTFDLTEKEAEKVQSMFEKLVKVIPQEREAD